jgi:hypothetical protein
MSTWSTVKGALRLMFCRPVCVARPDAAPLITPTESILASTVAQLKFLLSQAPMIDAPTDMARIVASKSPYAYVHPKTLAKFVKVCIHKPMVQFLPSPTRYVVTSLMPEGRIIYTPNPIPGLEKILAA